MTGQIQRQPLFDEHFFTVRPLREIAAFNITGNVIINNRTARVPRICELISKLGLPSVLADCCIRVVGPMSDAIANFIKEVDGLFGEHNSVLKLVAENGLRFKYCGILDYKEIMRPLVKDKTFSIRVRFRLACIYSLPAEVASLWSEYPIEFRHHSKTDCGLVLYWKSFCFGFDDDRQSDIMWNTFGIGSAVEAYNASSFEYFWSRVSEQERSENLVYTASGAINEDMYDPWLFGFCVSKMTSQQLIELITHELSDDSRGRPTSYTLRHLISWPWADKFLPIMELVHSSITDESDYDDEIRDTMQGDMLRLFELCLVASKCNYVQRHLCSRRYICTELQEDIIIYIWTKLSISQRHYVFRNYRRYFDRLFREKSVRCLSKIIVDDVDGHSLALSRKCVKCCVHYIFCEENWDVIKFLVSYLLKNASLKQLRIFESKIVAVAAGQHLNSCRETDEFDSLWKMDFYSFTDKLRPLREIVNESFLNK